MHKIKRSHAYPWILLALFAQVQINNFFGYSPFKPNLMIIITIFFALFTDERFAFEIGLLSGLLLDIFSIRFFGLNAALFSLGGYLAGRYNNKFYRDSIITHVIITFVMSFFILSLYFLFLNLRSIATLQQITLNGILSPSVFGSSLSNSLLAILVYAFLLRVLRIGEDII